MLNLNAYRQSGVIHNLNNAAVVGFRTTLSKFGNPWWVWENTSLEQANDLFYKMIFKSKFEYLTLSNCGDLSYCGSSAIGREILLFRNGQIENGSFGYVKKNSANSV